MAHIKSLYITVPTRAEAEKIAESVVSEGLAACANIVEGVTSIYRWEGKTHKESEVLMFLKVPGAKVEDCVARVQALHSYDVPCVLVMPVEGGAAPYLEWVAQAT